MFQTIIEHKFKPGDIVNHKTNSKVNFRIIAIVVNGNPKETICYMCINISAFGEKRNPIFEEGELIGKEIINEHT